MGGKGQVGSSPSTAFKTNLKCFYTNMQSAYYERFKTTLRLKTNWHWRKSWFLEFSVYLHVFFVFFPQGLKFSYLWFFSLQLSLHIGKPPEGWRGVAGKMNSHLLFVF